MRFGKGENLFDNIMKILILLLFFIFSIGLPVSGVPNQKNPSETVSSALQWTDILAAAKQNNSTLIKTKKSLEIANNNYYAAISNFLPQITASASAGRSGSDSSSASNDYSYGISGRLSLFSGFSDYSVLKIKNIELKIAKTEYDRVLSDMIYNLKRYFDDLLWAQEMVRLSEQILNRRIENYNLVSLKYEAGREDKGSLLRLDADKYQAETDLFQARRRVLSSSAQLSKEIGKNDFTVLIVTGSLTVEKNSALIETDYVKRKELFFGRLLNEIPEYINAEYSLKKAVLSVKSAKSEFYPSLTLSAGDSKRGDHWAPSNNSWNIGLSLSYPLFAGGKNKRNVNTAGLNREIAEESLREMRSMLFVKYETAANDLSNSLENLKVREKYLFASEEQSRVTTTKYINGLATYQDWYSVENDLINAQKSLLNAHKEYLLSEEYLKNILGYSE
ncbi:MAG: Outer membrane efflux protein BepC precursor [Elusimicrobia bacterium ADurb.Bin231]|nr:MAG: Outer membrane efflux protein BepC precursor [Elusimicrobia bacterium ADurb.Bin231]